jgi:hypothetical protein
MIITIFVQVSLSAANAKSTAAFVPRLVEIPAAPLFWQFLDGQLKLAGICPFNAVNSQKV